MKNSKKRRAMEFTKQKIAAAKESYESKLKQFGEGHVLTKYAKKKLEDAQSI